MKRVILFLSCFFAFPFHYLSAREQKPHLSIQPEWIQGANQKQLDCLYSEIQKVQNELDQLSPDERDSKLTEILYKLSHGFKIYNFVRKDPALQNRIKAFEDSTNIKV